MAKEPGYRKKAEQNVLDALQLAYMQKQEPVSISEVQHMGNQLHDVAETRLEITEYYDPGQWTHGGWTPFDWPDRTQRWLDVLVKKGLARIERRGRRIYYEPLVEPDPTRIGSIQIDMLTKGPHVSELTARTMRGLEILFPVVLEGLQKIRDEEEEKYLRDLQVRNLLEREGLLEEGGDGKT